MKDAINARVILLLTLVFLGMTLYGRWQEEHAPDPATTKAQQQSTAIATESDVPADIPFSDVVTTPTTTAPAEVTDVDRLISVENSVLKLKIDKKGGDIVYAELKAYPKVKGQPDQGYVLLDKSKERFYIAQTGLIAKSGPDSRTLGRAEYASQFDHYEILPSRNKVELFWKSSEGVEFSKIFEFEPDGYLIQISYVINNTTAAPWQGKMYGQLQRRQVEKSSRTGLMGMQTYEGGALFTPEKKFKKISYKDMLEKPVKETIHNGWVAQVEHYFLSAWVPHKDIAHDYYSSVQDSNKYTIGALTNVLVPANSQGIAKGQLYLGPEIANLLENVAPGLELTIDYGILWPISQLIFWAMKQIYDFVGNWGWSIILITVVIKALFYKLSAASYRSMGKLRRVQPKIEALKERLGDDKAKFSQSLMELYKKERINPLGGCLPILVQIPVFIALYYVLLESVELRQAPFMLWIQDLSAKDPYYVLPILMGATMLLQQKMSPAPPDPMQAKMLMIMPIIFTVLFLSFPSGLVLYWVVNNVLSISQQWLIMRKLEKEGLGHKPKSSEART